MSESFRHASGFASLRKTEWTRLVERRSKRGRSLVSSRSLNHTVGHRLERRAKIPDFESGPLPRMLSRGTRVSISDTLTREHSSHVSFLQIARTTFRTLKGWTCKDFI